MMTTFNLLDKMLLCTFKCYISTYASKL